MREAALELHENRLYMKFQATGKLAMPRLFIFFPTIYMGYHRDAHCER
jgi:hypothetical protein